VKNLSFIYRESDRENFSCGELRLLWKRKYPFIFSDQDFQIAINQPRYHFFEWLGAVMIFETTGFLSFIEQYRFKNHKDEFKTVKSFVPKDLFELLIKPEIVDVQVQPPDLFCYLPESSCYFFCEVKGKNDRLSDNQKKYFSKIEELSGRHIYLLSLSPI
jgi:hypothetical protein